MPAVQSTTDNRVVVPDAVPSTSGAAIAGSIIFGVLLVLLIMLLVYYGYRCQRSPPSTSPSAPFATTNGSSYSSARFDMWAGHLSALLHPARGLLTTCLQGAGDSNSRPRLHPWAALRSPAAYIPRPAPVHMEPPPPYDPHCLPGYQLHELWDVHPLDSEDSPSH